MTSSKVAAYSEIENFRGEQDLTLEFITGTSTHDSFAVKSNVVVYLNLSKAIKWKCVDGAIEVSFYANNVERFARVPLSYWRKYSYVKDGKLNVVHMTEQLGLKRVS